MARTNQQKHSVQKQDAENFRLAKFLVGLLCVAAAFAAGFWLRGNDVVLARLGFDALSADEQVNPGMTVSGDTFDSLSARVAEVQGILDASSLDTYNLDGATNDLLAALSTSTGDDFLRYYDAEHYATYLQESQASYAGVGVLFGERDGQAYVVDVFAGSEAEAKGVGVGDEIVAIDGDRGNDGWTAAEAVKNVTRAEGESVVITFLRPATAEGQGRDQYTVTLTNSNYAEQNVTATLEGNVGVVKLAQINQSADRYVRAALDELAAQGAAAYVLDLRDNPGGYLTQAVDVASLFVQSGVVVGIQTRDSLTTRQATGEVATNLPVVVLVNENTAATAEVIAGALQDNERAVVVGTTTMGKGSVQSLTEVSFGGALRYTSAFYQTPNGYNILNGGIVPDIAVAAGADEAVDVQLNLAVETAAQQVQV